MKAGVFTFNTHNLGDEMQSLAVLAHLNSAQAFMDRDRLAEFRSEEDFACIYNSWFLLGDDGRRPSPKIKPLTYGFCAGIENLLETEWSDYLKQHEPIGCRDLYSVELLMTAGIDAYWTGCLTLFLGQLLPLAPAERKGVLFIDVPSKAEAFIPPEIVQQATRLTSVPPLSIQDKPLERWAAAARMVDMIARAELVITRRLHAALPAASFNTPVVVIPDPDISWARRRFSGFEKIIPTVFLDEIEQELPRIDWRNVETAQIPDQLKNGHAIFQQQLDGMGLYKHQLQTASPLDDVNRQSQLLINVGKILYPGRLMLRLKEQCFELTVRLWSTTLIEVNLSGFPGLSKFDFIVEFYAQDSETPVPWGILRDVVTTDN